MSDVWRYLVSKSVLIQAGVSFSSPVICKKMELVDNLDYLTLI